jgi:hypothetical protein
MNPLRFAPLALFLASCAACSSSTSTGTPGAPPDDIACSSVVTAASSDEVQSAIDGAPDGACVVLTGSTYGGAGSPFTVKNDVALVGAKGLRPGVTRAIIVVGGRVANLDVIDVAGVGITLEGTSSLRDVKVTGAKSAGVTAIFEATLENVVLEKNAIGLLTRSAKVTIKGGRIAENGSSSLSSGAGIIAFGGTTLDLDGVTVEKNEGPGIVVDGAATRLVAKNVKVLDNSAQGIWVQGADGTLDAPAARVEQSEIARNKLVGVGALESRGIIVVGGRIAETRSAPTVTNLAKTEDIGDGLGIFKGGDVRVTDATLEANARAAGIIDGSDRGIIVVGGKVTAGASNLKVVVQNTTASVDIGADLRSETSEPLGVVAAKVQIPSF